MLPLTWGDSPRRGKHGFGPSGSWAAPTSHTPTKRRPSVAAMHGDSCIAQADVPTATPPGRLLSGVSNICSYMVALRWGEGHGVVDVGPGEAAYAELHCHSNFSFLDGASHPEELAEEAARLGLAALAITDHDGFYGVVRFAEAARPLGLPTVFGAELTLGAQQPPERDRRSAGRAPRRARAGTGRVRAAREGDQRGAARGGEGRAAHVARAARRRGARAGAPRRQRAARDNDPWFVLTGCRKGTVPAALHATARPRPSARSRELVDAFGRDRVLVELWDHGDPLDRHRNDALAQVALRAGVEVVATNNVHYATPAAPPARDRARRGPGPPFARRARRLAAGRARSRTCAAPAEQLRRFARWPGAVERTVEIADACAFDLRLAAPRLPDYPGARRARRHVVAARARPARRGRRATRRRTRSTTQAMRQIDYELR